MWTIVGEYILIFDIREIVRYTLLLNEDSSNTHMKLGDSTQLIIADLQERPGKKTSQITCQCNQIKSSSSHEYGFNQKILLESGLNRSCFIFFLVALSITFRCTTDLTIWRKKSGLIAVK